MPVSSRTNAPTMHRSRGLLALTLLALVAIALFTLFCALGNWQVHRLAWKRALIAQVDARAYAPAVAAPPRTDWPTLTAANAEYRHVRLEGHYDFSRQTLVQAATELGSGYWVLTPLRLADDSVVLINRGFVLPAWRKTGMQDSSSPQPVQIYGLLRMSEPANAFLRENNPAIELWYSRDLTAIAQARELSHIAPYFVDADAASNDNNRDPTRAPVGGLTVLNFSNNHLSYAITWYTLAAMVLVAAIFVARDAMRERRRI